MAYLIPIKICHFIYLIFNIICQIFNIIWYLPKVHLFTANTDFFLKSDFEFWAAIFETYWPCLDLCV